MQAHGWPCPPGPDPLFETGLANTLELLDANGIRATLFVIAEDLDDPAKRRLIEDAVRRGHDVGSHTLTHRSLTALPAREQQREIVESRHRVADALGVPVRGFRAPGFRIDRRGWDLVASAGYAYDSSRFGTVRDGDLPCRELPLPGHRPLPFPFHPSYALVLGSGYFRFGLRRFRTTAAPLVLLFHLTDLAAPLGADWIRGWRSRLFTVSHLSAASKRARCQSMLDDVRRLYSIVTTSELLEHP